MAAKWTHFLSSVQSSWETLCAVAAGTFWSLAYLENTTTQVNGYRYKRIANTREQVLGGGGLFYLLSRRSNTCLVVAKER